VGLLIQPGQKTAIDDLAKCARLTSPSMASRKSGWAWLAIVLPGLPISMTGLFKTIDVIKFNQLSR
jgi:hypothetical protein